jgi:acyl-coenzyme A synthetase/AMP-(fatty) acid ligase
MAVLESIFAYARSAPRRTALIANGCATSYHDFAASIVLVRRHLRAQAISRDRVAVMVVDNVADAWIIGLALRGLGVTTVNGRSAADIARLGLAAVSVVSTAAESGPDLAAAAADAGAPLIQLPKDACAAASSTSIDSEPPVDADKAGGHILLTSGTTGVYKKVLIDPALEAASVALRADLYGLSAGSVVNLFDFGGWTVAGYQTPISVWSQGGAVVVHQGPDRWRALAAPGLTLAYTQPQILADLLAAPAEVPLRNDAMTLIVGAGVLSQADWRAARERLTSDVRTGYGSTEAGPCALTRIETPEDLAWHRIHPAFQVQVVDDQHRPLPAGRTGAVRVRTSGIEGYLGDEAATRDFFRDGFFYPGDLGALRQDGRLSVLGRVTDVINVRGDKIPTTPIETALQDALGAKAVCVFSAPGADGAEEVHVAIERGRIIGPDELKAALLAALPHVPAARVHAVDGFARNHMGKIDRAILRARLLAGPPGGRDGPGRDLGV